MDDCLYLSSSVQCTFIPDFCVLQLQGFFYFMKYLSSTVSINYMCCQKFSWKLLSKTVQINEKSWCNLWRCSVLCHDQRCLQLSCPLVRTFEPLFHGTTELMTPAGARTFSNGHCKDSSLKYRKYLHLWV